MHVFQMRQCRTVEPIRSLIPSADNGTPFRHNKGSHSRVSLNEALHIYGAVKSSCCPSICVAGPAKKWAPRVLLLLPEASLAPRTLLTLLDALALTPLPLAPPSSYTATAASPKPMISHELTTASVAGDIGHCRLSSLRCRSSSLCQDEADRACDESSRGVAIAGDCLFLDR